MEQIINDFVNYLRQSKSASTAQNAASQLRDFLRSKKVTDVSKVTQQMISDYFEERRPHCSQEKFNLMIGFLKTFFRYHKVDGLEFPRQKHIYKKSKGTISEHELVSGIEPKLQYLFRDHWKVRAILYVLFYTGIHHDELLCIKKSNFSLDTNELIFTNPMTGRVRRIPLPAALVEVLRQYFQCIAEEKNLFNIERGYVNRICRVLQRNEVLGKKRAIKPNLFRNGFARLCIEKGVDVFVVSQLLGHKSVKTTFNCLMMSDEIKGHFLKKVK